MKKQLVFLTLILFIGNTLTSCVGDNGGGYATNQQAIQSSATPPVKAVLNEAEANGNSEIAINNEATNSSIYEIYSNAKDRWYLAEHKLFKCDVNLKLANTATELSTQCQTVKSNIDDAKYENLFAKIFILSHQGVQVAVTQINPDDLTQEVIVTGPLITAKQLLNNMKPALDNLNFETISYNEIKLLAKSTLSYTDADGEKQLATVIAMYSCDKTQCISVENNKILNNGYVNNDVIGKPILNMFDEFAKQHNITKYSANSNVELKKSTPEIAIWPLIIATVSTLAFSALAGVVGAKIRNNKEKIAKSYTKPIETIKESINTRPNNENNAVMNSNITFSKDEQQELNNRLYKGSSYDGGAKMYSDFSLNTEYENKFKDKTGMEVAQFLKEYPIKVYAPKGVTVEKLKDGTLNNIEQKPKAIAYMPFVAGSDANGRPKIATKIDMYGLDIRGLKKDSTSQSTIDKMSELLKPYVTNDEPLYIKNTDGALNGEIFNHVVVDRYYFAKYKYLGETFANETINKNAVLDMTGVGLGAFLEHKALRQIYGSGIINNMLNGFLDGIKGKSKGSTLKIRLVDYAKTFSNYKTGGSYAFNGNFFDFEDFENKFNELGVELELNSSIDYRNTDTWFQKGAEQYVINAADINTYGMYANFTGNIHIALEEILYLYNMVLNLNYVIRNYSHLIETFTREGDVQNFKQIAQEFELRIADNPSRFNSYFAAGGLAIGGVSDYALYKYTDLMYTMKDYTYVAPNCGDAGCNIAELLDQAGNKIELPDGIPPILNNGTVHLAYLTDEIIKKIYVYTYYKMTNITCNGLQHNVNSYNNKQKPALVKIKLTDGSEKQLNIFDNNNSLCGVNQENALKNILELPFTR